MEKSFWGLTGVSGDIFGEEVDDVTTSLDSFECRN